MNNIIVFRREEEVEYFSDIDSVWKRGKISEFTATESNFCAIIQEGTSKIKIPMCKNLIRKI